MARKEGMLSLGGGMSASMLREVVYSGLRMGTYELFKDKSVARTSCPVYSSSANRVLPRLHDASKGALSKEGLPLKVIAASIAATIGSALANPADLVKGW